MKLIHICLIWISLFTWVSPVTAELSNLVPDSILEEKIYNHFQKHFGVQLDTHMSYQQFESLLLPEWKEYGANIYKLALDALEDILIENENKSLLDSLRPQLNERLRYLSAPEKMLDLFVADQIRLRRLGFLLNGENRDDLSYTDPSILKPRAKIEWNKLNALPSILHHFFPHEFVHKTGSPYLLKSSFPKKEELKALFWYNTPFWNLYKRGAYFKKPRLYMFCRKNRQYPCLMLMRNKRGKLVIDAKGKPWSQPALGLSRFRIPSHYRNGNTPAGVYTIDGVMPMANRIYRFGKYRRLIINFIRASKNEINTKTFLPKISQDKSWWHPATVARDAGRNLFRIHGTGQKSRSPDASYYPFIPTRGCIAKRENRYSQKRYQDQRELLDRLMTASELSPNYNNETKISGLLYIVDVDNEKRAVTLNDLQSVLENKYLLRRFSFFTPSRQY